ncbi:MAG: hypothetical protein OSB46_14145 [Alphaproteobacteria bacterium]|nr:hypothetical protein [Alphaproteobacteria bacterium]
MPQALNRLYFWQDRTEQHARLSEMDAHMLKDIEVTRPEAVQEAREPFWMA